MPESELYDAEYWKNRPMELKHLYQTLKYIDFFEPKLVLDVGCGMGYFVHSFRYYGVQAYGTDVSEYAVQNAYGLAKGYVTQPHLFVSSLKFDLVICYDVLEHIPEDEIDDFIDNILLKYSCRWLLLSICVLGDPNLERDSTHVVKRSKGWWLYQFIKRGLKPVEVPKNFWFRHQLFLFEV